MEFEAKKKLKSSGINGRWDRSDEYVMREIAENNIQRHFFTGSLL